MLDVGIYQQLLLLHEGWLVFFSDVVSCLSNLLGGLQDYVAWQVGDGLDVLHLDHEFVGQVALSLV